MSRMRFERIEYADGEAEKLAAEDQRGVRDAGGAECIELLGEGVLRIEHVRGGSSRVYGQGDLETVRDREDSDDGIGNEAKEDDASGGDLAGAEVSLGGAGND